MTGASAEPGDLRPLRTAPSARALAPVLVAGGWIVVGLALVAGSPAPILAVPGALLVLWLPGRAISSALTPTGLRPEERLLLDIATSLGVAVLAGIAIAALGIRLGPVSWAVALLAISAVAGGIALVRARRAGAVEDPASFAAAGAARPSATSGRRVDLRSAALAVVGLALVLGALAVARQGAAGAPSAPFTTLWMLPASDGAVRVGLENEEGAATTYRVVLRAGTATLHEWRDVRVEPGARWETTVTIPAGAARTAEVLLYRDGSAQPYRRVDLGPVPTP